MGDPNSTTPTSIFGTLWARIQAKCNDITEGGFNWVQDGAKLIDLAGLLAEGYAPDGNLIQAPPSGPITDYFRADPDSQVGLYNYLVDRLTWLAALNGWRASPMMMQAFAGLYLQAIKHHLV